MHALSQACGGASGAALPVPRRGPTGAWQLIDARVLLCHRKDWATTTRSGIAATATSAIVKFLTVSDV